MAWGKYHNKKTVVNGITFDSDAESRRYLELKELSDKGVITGLELQKRFCIIPKVGKEREAVYIADFYYIDENGMTIVEDVKSPATAKDKVFILKRKLMLWQYPDLVFRIVMSSKNGWIYK